RPRSAWAGTRRLPGDPGEDERSTRLRAACRPATRRARTGRVEEAGSRAVAIALGGIGATVGPHTTMVVVMEPYSRDRDCPKCGNAGQATSVEYHAAASPTCALSEPAE